MAALSLELPAARGELRLELALAAVDDAQPHGRGVWIDPCLAGPHPGSPPARSRFPSSRPRRASGQGVAAPPGPEPRFSILLPVHDPDPVFLDRAIASVLRQTRPDWELCVLDDASADQDVRELLAAHTELEPRVKLRRSERPLGISGATNAALELAGGEFVLLLDHDDEIEADALAAFAAALAEFPDADLLYTDEATVDEANRWLASFIKPAWSPELFETNMYSCHLTALRRELVERLGGMRGKFDGSQDYDLVLRASEATDRIVHVPGVRYYWRYHAGSTFAGAKPYAYTAARRALEAHFKRSGRPGKVKPLNLLGCYRRRPAPAPGAVAALLAVTADDDAEAVARCATELASAGDAGVILACAGAAAAELATGVEATVVVGPDGASRAELLDLAAAAATGADWLLAVADPVAGATAGWLDELLTVAAIDGVGAVGAVVVSAAGRIEDGGVTIADGLMLIGDLDAELAFDDPQRASSTQTLVRDVSACSGPLLFAAATHAELGGLAEGGFDELAGADLCLRARERGLRVAVTPNARLERLRPARPCSIAERLSFQRRWWSPDTDPYYHPEFCRQRAIFGSPLRPEPKRAWRPPVSGDAPPASESAPRGLREELADAFLAGSGVEIGPLHSPLRLPPHASVRYVDRMPVTLLRRHYPELGELPLIEIDIGDDGERLAKIRAESQDFVIANHLLEHTGDPISTIGNWLRVLRPGGVIYLAVPDKRYTFDIEREPTPLQHMVRDHTDGPDSSRHQHFEEWARHVEQVAEDRVAERADILERIDYSVHTHVFTERRLLELIFACDDLVGPVEVEAMRRSGLETLVVIRKPDPAVELPAPAPAYDELPLPG